MAVEGERELEEFLTGVFEGRTNGEVTEEPAEEPDVVYDDPRQPITEAVPEEDETTPPSPEEEEPVEEEEAQPVEEPGSVAWAKKRYGEDPEKWAQVAYQQEQHISRIANEKQQAEAFAKQMADYAQYIEAQSVTQQQSGMPMSAQEEAWVEQSFQNPVQYAYQALASGNIPLYNGVIARLAEEDAGMAASVGAQAQMAVREAQVQQQVYADAEQARQGDLPTLFAESVQRTGIDFEKWGPAMSEKVGELGEYNPYVQAILNSPDPAQRDLAMHAIHDLVRTGQATARRAQETEHEARIRREGELRREAASVVTGSPHNPPAQPQHPFLQAMENEWRRAGQWRDDEG